MLLDFVGCCCCVVVLLCVDVGVGVGVGAGVVGCRLSVVGCWLLAVWLCGCVVVVVVVVGCCRRRHCRRRCRRRRCRRRCRRCDFWWSLCVVVCRCVSLCVVVPKQRLRLRFLCIIKLGVWISEFRIRCPDFATRDFAPPQWVSGFPSPKSAARILAPRILPPVGEWFSLRG